MKIVKQFIPDVIVIEPKVNDDSRGYFLETFRKDLFEKELGLSIDFLQDNESKSSKGVLRGLHFQVAPYAQSKLVRVIYGVVLDVAVDIRFGSKSFGQHVAVELSSENKRQMFIPRGFAHGFIVLSDTAIFSYKVDNYYSHVCERGLAFDDKHLNIDWRINKKDMHLSVKDTQNPSLIELPEYFNIVKNNYDE